MTTRIGINGFGRIGRQILKAVLEYHADDLKVVAVNDLFPAETNAHLFKYDSNYGIFGGDVGVDDGNLMIDGQRITGIFKDTSKHPGPQDHINKGGAKKVIISAPAKNIDLTVVLGVNDDWYKPMEHHILSNASCTTNCLAPPAKVIAEKFGIVKGLMTTIHSYTTSQHVLDLAHSDPRRSRAAALNIIPTTTGAAKAISLVLPELEGKIDGFALRVPTPTVSIVDVVLELEKDATSEEVNAALKAAADGPMQGIMGFETRPLVSMDFKGDSRSSIVDAALTWYDNEWGYACRAVDLAALVAKSL
jgi:glyceraldehyde 3-phosphate dehydrogenase